MAYIGKTPIVGNFQKCDSLSASATADYTLQVDSTNVVPESVNHMIVSLNGVIQAPTTAYTVSGSTLSFASALTSNDSIDFVILLGNVLDIGTPSDATVTTAKLSGDLTTPGNLAVTGTVEPTGDTASGDNAAIGYTSAEGLILTGQGSTNDVTIKNDADADAISIPTGTQHVIVEGRQLGIAYDTPATFDLNATGIVVGDGSGTAGISLYSSQYGHVAFGVGVSTAGEKQEGLIQYNHSSNRFQLVAGGNYVAYLYDSGAFTITGALSKGSGSFRIDHPLPEKKDTHQLVHSFIEGPQADLIYRGKIDLVNGTATVNIDTVSGMSEGTFVLLNREIQCFTSNETGWTAVKGSVSGNSLTITAQDETCTDTISWMVVGERQDQHMYDTEWTDENGKPIIEPLKETE